MTEDIFQNPFPDNQFKDSKGRWRTVSLFFETNSLKTRDLYPPLYTLKEEDYRSLPSLKRLYLEEEDPTEYNFAVRYLGGWSHWLVLSSLTWFSSNHLTLWRDELEVKLRAKGMQQLVSDSVSESKSSKASARYLAEAGFRAKKGAGRPSKADVDAEIKKSAAVSQQLSEDAERIGLKLVKDEQ